MTYFVCLRDRHLSVFGMLLLTLGSTSATWTHTDTHTVYIDRSHYCTLCRTAIRTGNSYVGRRIRPPFPANNHTEHIKSIIVALGVMLSSIDLHKHAHRHTRSSFFFPGRVFPLATSAFLPTIRAVIALRTHAHTLTQPGTRTLELSMLALCCSLCRSLFSLLR